jgi:hypothetical protein
MAQLRTAQWLRVWPDQGHSNLSIELKAIQAAHQVGQFGIGHPGSEENIAGENKVSDAQVLGHAPPAIC